MDCTNEAWQRPLEAAAALIEARSNQMVTAAEWEALRQAVGGCGGVDISVDSQD